MRFWIGLCGLMLTGLSLEILHLLATISSTGGVHLIEPTAWILTLECGIMIGCVVLGLLVFWWAYKWREER